MIGTRMKLAASALAMVAMGAAAELRDPTRPPPGWGAQPGAQREPIDAIRAQHLVIVDGRRYLMWQGRRYGVGERIGDARIERIEETQVWLATPSGTRRVPLFTGIEKHPPRSSARPTEPAAPDETKGPGK